jgi:hypothetical protein
MLRVVARTLHFFLPVLHLNEQLGMGTLIDTHKLRRYLFGPEYADCTTANFGEEVCRQKRDEVEKTYRASKARNLVSELQFKSAAAYFFLRAITSAPENYN